VAGIGRELALPTAGVVAPPHRVGWEPARGRRGRSRHRRRAGGGDATEDQGGGQRVEQALLDGRSPTIWTT
jgi:hypothetical protein